MRSRRFAVLVVVCCLAPSTALAKRDKVECSKASLVKLYPGWRSIPAALQKLPPGATLCGTNGAEVAFILSDLDLPALQKYYEPMFAELGCKPLTCQKSIAGPECACSKPDKRGKLERSGSVSAQSDQQVYALFYAEP